MTSTLPSLPSSVSFGHCPPWLQGPRTVLVLLVKVCGAAPQLSNGQPLTAQSFQAALFVGQTSVTSTWYRCSFGGVNIDQTHSNVVAVDAGCAYGAQGCDGCGVGVCCPQPGACRPGLPASHTCLPPGLQMRCIQYRQAVSVHNGRRGGGPSSQHQPASVLAHRLCASRSLPHFQRCLPCVPLTA